MLVKNERHTVNKVACGGDVAGVQLQLNLAGSL